MCVCVRVQVQPFWGIGDPRRVATTPRNAITKSQSGFPGTTDPDASRIFFSESFAEEIVQVDFEVYPFGYSAHAARWCRRSTCCRRSGLVLVGEDIVLGNPEAIFTCGVGEVEFRFAVELSEQKLGVSTG